MNEIVKFAPGEIAEDAAVVEIRRMADMLQTMAAMLQATTESMEQLRRQVRLLEKVTPQQAGAINRAIRERATELCAIYMIRDEEACKPVRAAIRKELKAQFGGTVKEIPRCDYEVALRQVQGWDDYRAMKGIREKVMM